MKEGNSEGKLIRSTVQLIVWIETRRMDGKLQTFVTGHATTPSFFFSVLCSTIVLNDDGTSMILEDTENYRARYLFVAKGIRLKEDNVS